MPPIFAATSLRAVEIDVEAGDLDAGLGELRRGLGAEPGGGSGDDGGVSFGIHTSYVRSSIAMTFAEGWFA